ncbi:hypothetical protein ACFVU2_07385 [Leifsonia sp. NPDC058194]|uniref:hypothetical protein n=1 Tax=Leifsonia sp. NPDC058194 TaxID=3346374 RepID=UPI0036DBE54E
MASPRPRRPRTRLLVAAALLATATMALVACTPSAPPPSTATSGSPRLDDGPDRPFVTAGPSGVTVREGDDWTLPAGVRPTAASGFFSEQASPADRVAVRSVDATWRQVQPAQGGPIDRDATGGAQEMEFASLNDQLATDGPFWMRLFASGEDWAPTWVAERCGVTPIGPDYDGQMHLPIWNECVWSALLDTYRELFQTQGLAADPRLRFVYVPGAFTWAEFDYDIIGSAAADGSLDLATYRSWYDHAWTDLVDIFGADSDKLVFTGEDYPFGPFGADDDLLARQAVDAGLGIRTGITELSNFHLSEAPSYGSSVLPNGHLVVDESLPIHDGSRVVATENECYTACGYTTDDPYYAVRQSNLKALQLRVNWMYVVPTDSYLRQYAPHWDWVRLSLGKTAATSADAWADLRDAEDTYWAGEPTGRFADPATWIDRPYVRNLERWLVQTDVPGSVAHRSDADVHRKVFEPDNGTAYEGLRTSTADGDTGLVFTVDDRFAAATAGDHLVLKVTFRDSGSGSFRVDYPGGRSADIPRTGDGEWKTATVSLPGIRHSAGSSEDLRIRLSLDTGADDLAVRFVRLITTTP